MTSIATTWGLSGPEFLWLYGALGAALAVAVLMARRRALGSAPRGMDQTPDLGIYEIAMLNGGAQLAITTAAVKLHRDAVLRAGSSPRTHYVQGELPAQADRLERAVFDAVSAKAGISTDELRTELADSEPIGWMTTTLTAAGLLVEPGDAQRLRGLWPWAAGLALLGVARIVAAALDEAAGLGYLTIAVVAVFCATVWIARRPTRATARGQALVSAERERHADVRRTPRASESVMAAALFGGGALWLADPAIASTLDVPREAETLGWGRGASSTVSTGCGGGGGGGWFGGGDGGGGGSSCGGGGGGCGGGGG